MHKAAYIAQCEQFCRTNNHATAKLAYDRFNQVWSDANAALDQFVRAQGPNARLSNGLTADYVKGMPEYRRLSAEAYKAGEQREIFTGAYTKIFAREHKAEMQAARESRTKDHSARWAALCATV